MLIDSHAHLDSDRYAGELPEILTRAKAAGIGGILAIGIGEGPAEMAQALGICRQYNGKPGMPQLWASAGIYPHNTHEATEADYERLSELLAEPEVIACGEIGLDYYHTGSPHPVQQEGFCRQMGIAAVRKRPILIHCRPAENDNRCWDDCLGLMEKYWAPTGLGGILHCFSGEWEHAERALAMGFLISFAGHVTYTKSTTLREIAARLPLESIVVETDAPFLAPIPNRGQRNEPGWVALTAAAVAAARGMDAGEFAVATTKNFSRLFQLAPNVGD